MTANQRYLYDALCARLSTRDFDLVRQLVEGFEEDILRRRHHHMRQNEIRPGRVCVLCGVTDTEPAYNLPCPRA